MRPAALFSGAKMTKQKLPEPGVSPVNPLESFSNAEPLDRVLTAIIAWLASGDFRERLAMVADANGPIEIAKIAETLGLPPMALQIWVGRDLAAETGKPVEAKLGDEGSGAIVVFRPKARVLQ